MKPCLHFSRILLLCTPLIIASCGGGGDADSSDDGNIPPTPPVSDNRYLTEPEKLSSSELVSAYTKHTDALYTGKEETASVNMETSHQFLNYLTGDDNVVVPFFNISTFLTLINEDTTNLASVSKRTIESTPRTQNINSRESCSYTNWWEDTDAGNITYMGELNAQGEGTLKLEYDNCGYYPNARYSGNIFLSISSNDAESDNYDYYLFFDELEIFISYYEQDLKTIKLSGYVHRKLDNNVFNTKENIFYNFVNLNKHLHKKSDLSYNYDTDFFSSKGELFDSELGHVIFESNTLSIFSPMIDDASIKLKGDISSVITYQNGNHKYLEDRNNDDVFEVGTYISDLWSFIADEPLIVELSDADTLSFPPVANSPYIWLDDWQQNEATTSSTIIITDSYYFDRDTPNEDLTISYKWFINNELVEGVSGDTLPAFSAVFGDEVQASVVVSDGTNVVESSLSNVIFIADSLPIYSLVGEVPEKVSNGDIVEFQAVVTDPDLGDLELHAATLVSAPEGTTIDESGNVRWQVSESPLFYGQEYRFIFTAQDNEEITNQHVESVIVESDKAFPIVRSGIEIPSVNHSVTIGDFNGDNSNEILSTDSNSRVFLLSNINDEYKQTWLYPFAFPTNGFIKQVIGVDLDEDANMEILVATEKGISVIYDIEQEAIPLWETDFNVKSIAVTRASNDDILVAVVTESGGYLNSTLSVFNIKQPDINLFNTTFDDTWSSEILFANVDSDDQVELITASGLVYDSSTWENQWYKGTGFGDFITAVDLTGDGSAEIIGAEQWGEVAVFSALTKEKLDSFANFNTCSLQSVELDNNSDGEILVGDCQWGNITAYNWENESLIEAWKVSTVSHGSKSIAVGDSDNDGKQEIHWGTGGSSSGANSFVVANFSSNSAEQQWINESPSQLGNFFTAGWASIDSINETAVFLVSNTDSGYGEGRLFYMDSQGNTSISDEISSSYRYSQQYASVNDFNNDGFGDVFMPSSTSYDGTFSAVQLNDFTSHWEVSSQNNNDVGVIDSFDTNADGFEDAVYTHGSKLSIIDIHNEVILANIDTYEEDSYRTNIIDFAVDIINNKPYIAISSDDQLSLWNKPESSYQKVSTLEHGCKRLNYINIDEDEQLELACLITTPYYYDTSISEFVVYEINDGMLVESKRFQVPFDVKDFVVDTSKASEQSIFVAIRNINDYWQEPTHSQIVKVSSKGHVIFLSPKLVGEVHHRGLRYRYSEEKGNELLLSTNRAAYYIN